MKKDKTDIRITINLTECGCPDKVTSTMGFLNEMAIAFNALAELNAIRGCDALARRARRRCDQIHEVLDSRGLYDDYKG